MPNSNVFHGPDERFSQEEGTGADHINAAMESLDHLHEAANALMDTDNPDRGIQAGENNPITFSSDGGAIKMQMRIWRSSNNQTFLLVRFGNNTLSGPFPRSAAQGYLLMEGTGALPAS